MAVHRPEIVIVTPASAAAQNGNWQTAQRWWRMLSPTYPVRVARDWTGGSEHLMIALHARRSAPAIAHWRDRSADPDAPVVLALTGTDLYRDIEHDVRAQRSLASADTLIVLNEIGMRRLPEALHHKTQTVLQSCSSRRAMAKPVQPLSAVVVGNLRPEKSPQTCFEAMRLLEHRTDIRMDHLGAALDAELGAEAAALTASCPAYRWLGEKPHMQARRRIQAAHVLVHPSRLEGGAHVVIEAVRSGTPVLASRIEGNIGLLGEDYDGYFPVGDAAALAAALIHLREEPAFLAHLHGQCQRRDALFEPARERAALLAIVERCWLSHAARP